MFISLMILAAVGAPQPTLTLPLPIQHYAQAPLASLRQTTACFGRAMTLVATTKGKIFQITAMRGFTGNVSRLTLKKINSRLATLPDVVQVSVSCARDSELINFEALSPNWGRNLNLSLYLQKESIEFFPQ